MRIALAQMKTSKNMQDNLDKSIKMIDTKGNVVAKAKDEEQILYADIDLSDSAKIRKDRPYTDLRRTEFYR